MVQVGAPRILYNNIFNSSLTTASTVDASDTAYNVANIYDMRPYTLWQSGTATGTKTITINTGSTTSVANALGIVGHNLFTAGATFSISALVPTTDDLYDAFDNGSLDSTNFTIAQSTAVGATIVETTWLTIVSVGGGASPYITDKRVVNSDATWDVKVRVSLETAATAGARVFSIIFNTSLGGREQSFSLATTAVGDAGIRINYTDNTTGQVYYYTTAGAWTTASLRRAATATIGSSYVLRYRHDGTNIHYHVNNSAETATLVHAIIASTNVFGAILSTNDFYLPGLAPEAATYRYKMYDRKTYTTALTTLASAIAPSDNKALISTFANSPGTKWYLNIQQPTTVKVKLGVVTLGQTMDFPRAEGRNINPEAHRTISDGADSNTLQPLGVIKRGKLRERQVSINGLPATWIRDTFYPAWSTYLADGNPFFYQWNSTLSSAVYYSQMAANSAFVSNYMENTDYRDLTFNIKGRFEE